MIWPFKRKRPLNPGPINEDWAYGDLAECVSGEDWFDGPDTPVSAATPETGEVNKVLDVKPARSWGGDMWFLKLGGYQGWWETTSFRKVPPLNSKADAEFTAKIKALKPKRIPA